MTRLEKMARGKLDKKINGLRKERREIKTKSSVALEDKLSKALPSTMTAQIKVCCVKLEEEHPDYEKVKEINGKIRGLKALKEDMSEAFALATEEKDIKEVFKDFKEKIEGE